MSKYVKNADLTVEYIVMRAFQLGASQVYTDIREGHSRQIVTVWPIADNEPYEITAFPMQPYHYHRFQPPIDFSNNLSSFRRMIENQGLWLKLMTKGGDK